jgi:hypothetical protein
LDHLKVFTRTKKDRAAPRSISQREEPLVLRHNCAAVFDPSSDWSDAFKAGQLPAPKTLGTTVNQFEEIGKAVLIYFLWPGYLDRPKCRLRDWCSERNIELKICHTSGHADTETPMHFAAAPKPQRVVPIHTAVPRIFEKLIPNTLVLPDGRWLEV